VRLHSVVCADAMRGFRRHRMSEGSIQAAPSLRRIGVGGEVLFLWLVVGGPYIKDAR
jgi:hypothetical protein